MASFIKIRPFMTDDLLLGPPRRRGGALHVVPHESSVPLSCHQEVIETEKELRISLDVPGVKASDLSVTTDNQVVHIAGSRRTFGAGGETAKKSRFSKSFAVDTQTVDVAQLKANLADGVLVVTAPKKTKPAPRSIMISTEPHALESEEFEKEKKTKKDDMKANKTKEKASSENESGENDQAKK